MIIPVRCFTCGKVLADKWENWVQMEKDGVPVVERYAKLKLTRICCKKIMFTHVPLIDKILKYQPVEEIKI